MVRRPNVLAVIGVVAVVAKVQIPVAVMVVALNALEEFGSVEAGAQASSRRSAKTAVMQFAPVMGLAGLVAASQQLNV